MSVAIITGAAGLIGSEATRHFAGLGMQVVGIDNDTRRQFFGEDASTAWQRAQLQRELGPRYTHRDLDIRDDAGIEALMRHYGKRITLVIHTAAQPSHDWAARDPKTDFAINATGTLNMLEATRLHCADAAFIFTSTNKVYGDRPNQLPLVELETRYEIADDHQYADGITESMSIDHCVHSVFGASKVAADVMVQEYGRYFGLQTVCFRGGCLTGPNHSATRLHGFLAYLTKCAATGMPYTVFGYQGKQVRDNIHSHDLIRAFEAFHAAPRVGEVYNIGGGRHSHCSMLEAIAICEEATGRPLDWHYSRENRLGDHVWWISNCNRFRKHYPQWDLVHDVEDICRQIYHGNADRWLGGRGESGGRITISVSIGGILFGGEIMIDAGSHNVLGIQVDALDYEASVHRIMAAAESGRPLTVSALAVHGVMTGVRDLDHRYRLNALDLVLPDGQPVRWALRWLHGIRLVDRVYGPELMLRTCRRAAEQGLPIFLYGGTPSMLDALTGNLRRSFPGLQIAGSRASLFRQLQDEREKQQIIEEIRASGAAVTFVGLGCPRQEVWAYEFREALNMPILAVGAAFSMHAGMLPQAPQWMQQRGLEWSFRLFQEPRRLWRRYLLLNPIYLSLVTLQWMRALALDPAKARRPQRELHYG